VLGIVDSQIEVKKNLQHCKYLHVSKMLVVIEHGQS
jgi:hypothetical protein